MSALGSRHVRGERKRFYVNTFIFCNTDGTSSRIVTRAGQIRRPHASFAIRRDLYDTSISFATPWLLLKCVCEAQSIAPTVLVRVLRIQRVVPHGVNISFIVDIYVSEHFPRAKERRPHQS